jgi:hypothetical protein
MDPQTFRRFLSAPETGALLDRLIEDNAAVDARLATRYVIRRRDGCEADCACECHKRAVESAGSTR